MTAAAEAARCRVQMWTVVAGKPQDDVQLLGETTWELLHTQIEQAGGVRLADGTFQYVHAGVIYRYRAVDAVG